MWKEQVGRKRAKEGEVVYLEPQGRPRMLPRNARRAVFSKQQNNQTGTVALHLDFVAKPEGSREAWSGLEAALSAAELWREGLESSILLVSDREARLVTLLTFWDAGRFPTARESRIAWMQKVLAPFADGSVRAHTSVPRFLAQQMRRFDTVKTITRMKDETLEHAVAG